MVMVKVTVVNGDVSGGIANGDSFNTDGGGSGGGEDGSLHVLMVVVVVVVRPR